MQEQSTTMTTTFAGFPAKSNKKGVMMMRYIVLCVLVLFPFVGKAEPPPPVPDGGLIHYKQEPCTDHIFGLTGECFYSHDNKNNRYKAFYVGDLGMAIFQLIDGEYVEIWRRSPDV